MATSGRRTLLWVVLAVVGVVAVLAVIGAVTDSEEGGGGGTDEPPSAVAAAAGCTPVEKEKVKEAPKHVGGEVDYDVAPPHSGNHSPNTLRNAKRFYAREDSPSVEQAVHNLEHGLVVAWYDPELPADQVAILEQSAQGMGSRYVVVPWDRSSFPGGRHFALTAWGVRQYCERVSAEHIRAFIEDHADTDAPEKGYSV